MFIIPRQRAHWPALSRRPAGVCLLLVLGLITAAGAAPETVRIVVGADAVDARLSTSAISPRRGVVALLPDGLGPRAERLAGELAAGLAAHGWDVVHLPTPLAVAGSAAAGREALAAEVERLLAAVRGHMRRGGRTPALYVVGHGWGGVLAAIYLAGSKKAPVAGLALINPAPPPGVEWPALRHLLADIAVPVYEVYGSRAYPRVTAAAPERAAAAARKAAGGYRQRLVVGADHFFTGREDLLVKRIRGWLRTQSGK